jgi:hypothetical protein
MPNFITVVLSKCTCIAGIEYLYSRAGIELTLYVEMSTDYTNRCKMNYNKITATMSSVTLATIAYKMIL